MKNSNSPKLHILNYFDFELLPSLILGMKVILLLEITLQFRLWLPEEVQKLFFYVHGIRLPPIGNNKRTVAWDIKLSSSLKISTNNNKETVNKLSFCCRK
ncbi:hypothetical protein CEXT_423481 [Caerostris extrusa]|uniref:Uncharacterized protein n=1 Tax=Caerostris extrusa TaxID=172846 RepID=A0AAV4V4I3_CAEEX|nr:hypothetical protein CEXT_423481 [Caerostris extrusa]